MGRRSYHALEPLVRVAVFGLPARKEVTMTTRILQWTVGLFLITGAAIAYGQGGAEVEAKQATSDRSKAEAELRATDLAWSAAASRKDVDATVAFMADDGETLPPNEPARWSPSVGSPGPGLVWIHSSTRNARWFFLRASGPGGSLPVLAELRGRVVYIHMNNTNPILDAASPEASLVQRAGIEIAMDGMSFEI
jgi:hypothetical protein